MTDTAPPSPCVVVGLAVAGRALARALVARGSEVRLVDDFPSDASFALADELGLDLLVAPDREGLSRAFDGAAALVASPGLPEWHEAFAVAAARGVPVVGELDLAATWDSRPTVAITGTDGKTTVTTLVTRMLVASGVAATEAGNTEVPMVEAIADPAPEVFVVEASSFLLAPLRHYRPVVGTWLNFAPDHLDVHRDLSSYEAAKASVWARHGGDDLAVVNADDPVVAAHAPASGRVERFSVRASADWHVVGEGTAAVLHGPAGPLVAVAEMSRGLPHDRANALAAAATAMGAGATLDGVVEVLRSFTGLPHRVQLVGEAGGVRWYDDSKATAPHATLAALDGFASVVLIAGGRNKGLDLTALATGAERVRAVVAVGEAAAEVEAAFRGIRPVATAASMDEAVALAAEAARPGDAVLLSPACASYDWYRSYAHRGDDFARAVRDHLGVSA